MDITDTITIKRGEISSVLPQFEKRQTSFLVIVGYVNTTLISHLTAPKPSNHDNFSLLKVMICLLNSKRQIHNTFC